jgi:hypothetical protein
MPTKWSTCVIDTTAPHGNKKISISQVCDLLFWEMITAKNNLRDIETQSELTG